MVTATLKNYRQSPRKVRLVADLIKGQTVAQAMLSLSTSPQRATDALKKLLESAVANAKENTDLKPETLIVKNIRVDEGITMKRWLPRAFGRATPLRKRNSHIVLELDSNNSKN